MARRPRHRLGRHPEPACAARRPGQADRPARHRHRCGAVGSLRLLRPQRRRRRGRRCAAAGPRRRRAGACATHAGAGTRLGAQGRRPADDGARRPGGRRHAAGLRLRHQLPQQRRAHAGPAADRHRAGGGSGLRDGRPHVDAAVCLCRPAHHRARHGARAARQLAARRVGAAQQLRARELHRRAGHRRRCRPGGLPPAPPARRPRRRAAARHCRQGRLEAAHRAAAAAACRSTGRLAARAGRGLCPLHPQQVPRLRRRLGRLGGRRAGAQDHRRGACQPGGGGP